MTKERLKKERCGQCIAHARIHPKFQHTPSSEAMERGLKDTLPESVDSPWKIKNQITSFSWKSTLSNLKSFPIVVFGCPCTGLWQVNYTREENVVERWGKMGQLGLRLTGIGQWISNSKAMAVVTYKHDGVEMAMVVNRTGATGECLRRIKKVAPKKKNFASQKMFIFQSKILPSNIQNPPEIQTGSQSTKQSTMIVKWTVNTTITASQKTATSASSQNLLRQNFNCWQWVMT